MASLVSPIELGAGTYYWRLATRDSTGELGPYGDTHTFELRPIPAAPSQATAQIGEDTVALRWQAGLAGQTYAVQFASNETFSENVRVVPSEEPELVIQSPEKTLWFRVRTIDIDGYEGPYGTAQRIEIPEESRWYLLGIPLLWLLPAL